MASPGFIDVHAHGGSGLPNARAAESKVHDGVTTEVLGNCGFSPFPSEPCRAAAACFDAVEEAGTAIHRAFLVGLGAVRSFVMGSGAGRPTAADLSAMRGEVERALHEGAFGVSTGLIYPPGCFADREEMAALVAPAGEAGALYATHLRSEGDAIEAALDEAAYIARTAGARLHISHVKLSGERNWHKIDWLEERLDTLRRDGIDLTCDRYPYTASATDLGVLAPDWVHDGPPERRVERLQDREVRRRARDEMTARTPPAYWKDVILSSVPGDAAEDCVGRSLDDVARDRGEEPADTVLRLLAGSRDKPSVVIFCMREENLRRVLSWPFVAIGSDARARPTAGPETGRPHPRAYGTFSRFLGRYVRKQKLVPLEEAVRRMTSLPADTLGLGECGVLREGARADITVFDPATVADRATYEEPRRFSAGIRHVIVNGRLVVEDGAHTGALPGRVLRRTR